jgi:DNA-directed RNA polymerase specialized sigma24 family protein
MVIRNAIQLILGIDNDPASDAGSEFQLQPSEYRIEDLRQSVAILNLPDLDRLAFVICVLERLSVLDCALLLKRSPRDVCEAIARATNRLALAEGQNHPGTTNACRTIAFRPRSGSTIPKS